MCVGLYLRKKNPEMCEKMTPPRFFFRSTKTRPNDIGSNPRQVDVKRNRFLAILKFFDSCAPLNHLHLVAACPDPGPKKLQNHEKTLFFHVGHCANWMGVEISYLWPSTAYTKCF